MSHSADHPIVRFPPPLVFLGFLLLGPVVDLAVGWQLRLPDAARWGIGGFGLTGGIAMIVASIDLFRRAGENPEPWTGTDTLVTSGIYRFTRNPMYLGMAVAHLGLALLIGSAGALATLPMAVLAIDRFVIPAEEAYLERKLGDIYARFRKSVRRWL